MDSFHYHYTHISICTDSVFTFRKKLIKNNNIKC
nr:MAG TPA: hypothetical protein [Caudoviricetes sp.]